MIALDSSLRNLPPNLDAKQCLVLDGLRHAAEIANLSYRRLQKTLTDIAVAPHDQKYEINLYTSAFLDAWAFIDAVDRFRMLWWTLPKLMGKPKESQENSFSAKTQDVRNLRNVSDHLDKQADRLVATKSTALGVLEWMTVTEPEENKGLMCMLVPGTVKPAAKIQYHTAEAGQVVELPTGYIHLSIGKERAHISNVFLELEKRVRELEEEMTAFLQATGGPRGGADILVKMAFHIQPETPTAPVKK